jgi:DNA-nicking Smr family endonuclease
MADRKSGSGKGGKNGDNKDLSPSDEDSDLWRAVTKDIKPLPGKPAPPKRTISRKIQLTGDKSRQNIEPEKIPGRQAGRRASSSSLPGIDHHTDDRLRRGLLPIEARLDLHGLTQDQALRSLRAFVRRNHDAGKRCVLVVTGKGRRHNADDENMPWYESPPGVLRDRVPDWLRSGDMADMVLRFYPARPQHGGDGALYVLLRRNRER